jgi:monoamine oxidase
MANSDTEVVIIGGGAAGIAACHRLRQAGIGCLIVEARERLGGRAWTVTDPTGAAIDLGCGWLHSADRNPWAGIARTLGLTLDETPPPWTRPSLTRVFPLEQQRAFIAALHAFYERVGAAAQREPDVAAASLLEPHGRWNGLIGAVVGFISGGDLARVSARDFDNYADTEVNWRVREGYGATMAAYGEGLPAVLGCAVRRIDHSGKRLRIETELGAIAADRVIVTLPSTVIAEREDLFAPALPDKTQAAASLPLGLNDKLFIALDGADEFESDSRLFGHTERSATAAYHLRPFGRAQIECYFGGSLAVELESAGEGAFYEFAVSELTGALGHDFAKRLKPIRLHRWGADPFARGSYSYALPGKSACRAQLAAPVDDRIFFAGEACSTHDFSTAHGGFNTGLAAAELVVAVQQGKAA